MQGATAEHDAVVEKRDLRSESRAAAIFCIFVFLSGILSHADVRGMHGRMVCLFDSTAREQQRISVGKFFDSVKQVASSYSVS